MPPAAAAAAAAKKKGRRPRREPASPDDADLELAAAPKKKAAAKKKRPGSGRAAPKASSSRSDVTAAKPAAKPAAAPAAAASGGGDVHVRMKFKPWMQALYFMADAWLAHIGWTIMYGFIWSLFWHQVDPTDDQLPLFFSMVFFLVLMSVPWVLESPRVMRAVDSNLDLVSLVLPICFLLALGPFAPMRTAVMAAGAVVQFTNIGLIWSRPSTDFRSQSFRYALPLGLLLLLIVRWNQGSINPLFNADQFGVAGLIGFTGFAACAIVIACRRLRYLNNQDVVFHENPDLDYDNESPHRRGIFERPLQAWWLLTGASYASFLFIVMWLFTSTAAITRWAGLHPYPYGVLIIGSLTLGVALYYAIERHVDAVSVNGLEMEPPLWLIGADAAALNLGCGLMVHGEQAPAVMFGGCLAALVLPLTLFLVLKDLAFLRASRTVARAIGTGSVCYCIYGFMQLGVLVGGEGTIFGDFHSKPAAALWIMSLGTFLGPLGMWARRHYGLEVWHGRPAGLSRAVPFPIVAPSLGICLFVFLLPWLAIRPTTWAQDAAPVTADGALSLASINVLRGYRDNGAINVDKVLDAVEASDWGLVALQESDAVGPAYGNRDLVGYWMYYLNTFEFYGLSPRDQTFGCAYLTHHYMTAKRVTKLFSQGDCTDCPPPNRVLLRGEIEYNGTTVAVYNTQLDDLTPRSTETQAAEVAAIIQADVDANLTDAFVLMGDFRVAPTDETSSAVDRFDTILAPLFNITGPGGRATVNAYEQANSCVHVAGTDGATITCRAYNTDTASEKAQDQIFVNGLSVANMTVIDGLDISNHKVLAVRLLPL